jgi:hypothetical protein
VIINLTRLKDIEKGKEEKTRRRFGKDKKKS